MREIIKRFTKYPSPLGLRSLVTVVDFDAEDQDRDILVHLVPVSPQPVQVARRLEEATRRLSTAKVIDDKRVVVLSEFFLGELTEGSAWRAALKRAGETYQQGLELEDDEEHELKDWVRCALEVRLDLDRAAFRTGNRPALRVLRRLDEALAGMRNAVMLLDPEEYNEILAGQEPPPGAWWGARLELEAAVPEEEVSRALVEMGEE